MHATQYAITRRRRGGGRRRKKRVLHSHRGDKWIWKRIAKYVVLSLTPSVWVPQETYVLGLRTPCLKIIPAAIDFHSWKMYSSAPHLLVKPGAPLIRVPVEYVPGKKRVRNAVSFIRGGHENSKDVGWWKNEVNRFNCSDNWANSVN